MAFVSVIPDDQAGPELRPLYNELKDGWGFLPNFWQAQGRRPDLIRVQNDLYVNVFTKGVLPQAVKEQIGLVVAGINTSSYCVAIHMEILRRLGIEKPLARKLATDHENATADPKVLALFRFAAKLTRKPGDIFKEDVDALRSVGWGDDEIYETVMTVAAMSLFNRVSLGLGLVADF